MINLLYKDRYQINLKNAQNKDCTKIDIMIPTIGEVLDDEENYYNLVYTITAMPIDMMVQLDDVGIDFTSINAYELFLLMFDSMKSQDTRLVFGDLDLSNFHIYCNRETGKYELYDKVNNIVINRTVHNQIASALRKIHHLEKNRKRPANEEAKKFLLQRARQKMKLHKNRNEMSELESLIISLVNTEQFKYDFEGVKNMSIYQFNESLRQVIKKNNYNNLMYGVYAGTIDTKGLSQEDMIWLSSK